MTVIQYTHIQHQARNVNLDSSSQGSNIALSWALNSLRQTGTSTRSTHLSTVAMALAYYEST